MAHGNVPCPAFMALEGHLARTTNSLLSDGSGQASLISGISGLAGHRNARACSYGNGTVVS